MNDESRSSAFEFAHARICELIDRFEKYARDNYLQPGYLLNSGLLTWRFRSIGKLKSGGIYEYFWNSISRLPIRRIDFSDPEDRARHDRMVELVDHMLVAKRQEAAATGHAKEIATRKCASIDREIDALVYELYGLTEEEIALVEESA